MFLIKMFLIKKVKSYFYNKQLKIKVTKEFSAISLQITN